MSHLNSNTGCNAAKWFSNTVRKTNEFINSLVLKDLQVLLLSKLTFSICKACRNYSFLTNQFVALVFYALERRRMKIVILLKQRVIIKPIMNDSSRSLSYFPLSTCLSKQFCQMIYFCLSAEFPTPNGSKPFNIPQFKTVVQQGSSPQWMRLKEFWRWS